MFFSCVDRSSTTKKHEQSFYPTYTKNLEDRTHTLELMYIAFFCQCANWATPLDIDKYQDTGILSDHSIFVEPADSTLALPDTLGYSADIIKFTGQFYREKGYPEKYPKTEMKANKARVFRYNKFEIVRSNYREFVNDSVIK